MKSRIHHYQSEGWTAKPSSLVAEECQLVLAFGASECVGLPHVNDYLKKAYPRAAIISASTAGEIYDSNVYDNSVVVTAIQLERSTIKSVCTNISEHTDSFNAGLFLRQQIDRDDLSGIFIISDGTLIEGSELVRGFSHDNFRQVPITGGLAGDGARFQKTLTGLNGIPEQGNIIAVGFYGPHIHIGHGSLGGWDEFGPERMITRSSKNVLFEIDGKPALDLYKNYLGDYAKDLPGSALLFPLSMRVKGSNEYLIRTVLAVSDAENAMTFAGDMPEQATVRLMRANFNKLIEAAAVAARNSLEALNKRNPDLTLLISCVGRKIILHNRVAEEVEAAEEVLGSHAVSGFYSYGGISPFGTGTTCALHNQTMTITTFLED